MHPLARALVIGIAVSCACVAAQTLDLVIANGRVLDPESGLDGVRNIGISNGRIVRITSDRLAGRSTIDA
ncbi:MAG: D-glutamate deacylase, partial [Acidobacteria bacterium]